MLFYSVLWWFSLSFCVFVPDFELNDKRFYGKVNLTKLLECTGIFELYGLRYFPKIYPYSMRNLQDTCPVGLSKDETGIVYPIS